jgi:Flp pilus assembly protein TadG
MKRLISLLLFLLLCCAFQASAGMNAYIAGSVAAAAAGKTCAADSAVYVDNLPDQDDFWSIGADASPDSAYAGQGNYSPAANITLCSVKVDIRSVVGTTTDINWEVQVYQMSGNKLGDIVSGDCTSDTQKITTTGTKTFTGLECNLDSGTNYAIVVTRDDHEIDANNYLIAWVGTSNVISGNYMDWNAAKTVGNNGATKELSIELWGFER